jgi:hypothetical protein
MLAVFGVVLPLRALAYANPGLLLDYRGVVLALVTVFGYMLTDLGHYGVFKLPKYRTIPERIFFALTLLTVLGLIVKWQFFDRCASAGFLTACDGDSSLKAAPGSELKRR